jgi:D-glycero-D-manno-heptose 1,7-bisphosphate phosphatase
MAMTGTGHTPPAVPAIFIDKDGTLVHDVPHNVDPDRIVLREGAVPALQRLQAEGYKLVLVSNQSGVAHGLFAETALKAVWMRIENLLAEHGVRLSAIHYCPHHPDGSVAAYATTCLCRKPQAGMLTHAAAEQHIDLCRSWMIGDILDDIEAGRRAGCRTALLDVGSETEWIRNSLRMPDVVAAGWDEAVEKIVAQPRSPEFAWA